MELVRGGHFFLYVICRHIVNLHDDFNVAHHPTHKILALSILMPSLQIASGDVNIGGPGRVPANFEFTGSKALDGAPTGFTQDQISLELINQKNTAALT